MPSAATCRGGDSRAFGEVVLACHGDQSLALLAGAITAEHAVLGAIRYQPNGTLLCTPTQALCPAAA